MIVFIGHKVNEGISFIGEEYEKDIMLIFRVCLIYQLL